MMSRPISACLRTTSVTAERIPAARAAGSTGTPSSFANIVRVSSSGRGRLPVWVVRMRSVLRSIGGDLNTTSTRRVPFEVAVLRMPRILPDEQDAEQPRAHEGSQVKRPGEEPGSPAGGAGEKPRDDKVEEDRSQQCPPPKRFTEYHVRSSASALRVRMP